MSKRRKNAGEGYGYMFHGAFSKKADAVAKEKKTKGAWIKGTPTNQGYRYIVMSPRTNPRKRKPKVPKVTPNPSELLVMGANPHETQELNLPAGSTITIRVNPEPRENLYLGFGAAPKASRAERARSRREFKSNVRRKTKEERAEFKRLRGSARASFRGKGKLQKLFHEVYGENPAVCGARIGGEVCTRKPGHRGPHLPQGATMRTRGRLPHHWQPRDNPSAAALRETFTGMEATHSSIHDEPHMPKGDYAQLGEVLTLYVKPLTGGQVQMIKPRGAILVSDESARQLWFVGGDQDITSALHIFGARLHGEGIYRLGEARRLDYKQRKEHVSNPDSDEWRHDLGEENGIRPNVLFDTKNKRLLLEGGDYRVEAAGIVN